MYQPLHILHIFPYYCPPDGQDAGGGTKVSTLTLLEGLDPSRYASYVLLPSPSSRHDPAFLRAGARALIYLDDPEHLVVEFARIRSVRYVFRYAFRFARHVLGIKRILKEYQIDVVHSQTSSFLAGALAARLSGVPSVVHVREYPFRFPEWLRWVYFRTVLAVADRVVCCAEFIRQGFLSAGGDSKHVLRVYNAVSLQAYGDVHRPSLKEELGLRNGYLVGYVGRLAERKGVEYFLEAAQCVLQTRGDVDFVVVGDVDESHEREYKQRLLDLASRIKPCGHVHFLGSRSDMPEVYSSLDLLVFSSPQDMGPRVPIEAMAMGVPVVSASSGGAEEEVEHGVTGLHVRPADSVSIAHAVVDLLSDEDRLRRMRGAARERVSRLFSQERYANEAQEIYDTLAHGY